jgi:hypothetical protein
VTHGVYDFNIPSAKSRSWLEGFGSPVGLDKNDGEEE